MQSLNGGSVSRAFKRLPQPLDFETGAKQREQVSDQYDATAGHQQDVGVAAKLRQMPEDTTENNALPKIKLRRPRNKSA